MQKKYSKGSKNISASFPLEIIEPLEELAVKSNTPRNRLIVQAVADMLKKANKAMSAKTLPMTEE